MMVSRPNVLVLDEPTNHLDLESIHALVQALQAFDGTVLFVSHDRAFVSALATRILEVTKDGFRDFPGTYDEYLAHLGDDHLDTSAVVLRAKKEKAVSAVQGLPLKGFRGRSKRRNNRRKQLPGYATVWCARLRRRSRGRQSYAMWCEPGSTRRQMRRRLRPLRVRRSAAQKVGRSWLSGRRWRGDRELGG
jgi:ABC-type multidrug transport system ATPase subunit